MTLQTGIDLVEVERIRQSLQKKFFLDRVFSPEERMLFRARGMNPQTIAANFAAKEAFAKALGTGVRGFSLSEVSLLRDDLGRPYYALSGKAREIAEWHGYRFSVSVTHTKDYASAVAVCYREGEETK